MDADPKNYLAFLLRLWQVNQNGERVWRASLEDSHTGERRGFNNLDKLMEFLKAQTGKGQALQSELPECNSD